MAWPRVQLGVLDVLWRYRRSSLILAVILLVGLAVRLTLAPFSSGSDIVQFAGFAKTIQRHGFCFYNYAAKYYSERWPYNWPYIYGPVLAYILGLLSYITPPEYTIHPSRYPHVCVSTSWVFTVKLVFIVFDTIVALLIYKTTRRSALFVLYYLNPAVIYTSSIYGMFDQIPLALMLLSLTLLEKKPKIAGVLLATALLTKQTVLFPVLGVLIAVIFHYRSLLVKVLLGFTLGVLIVFLPILTTCPESLMRLSVTIRETSYMWRPNYVKPLMYSFNGLTSILTLIHSKLGLETLWFIEHWYLYTLILLPLLVLYTLRERDIYLNTLLYYLLFTTTYWGINYQYLTPLIGLLAVGLARKTHSHNIRLYRILILYTASWFFIFPVKWWFYAHIEEPNKILVEALYAISLNIYVDDYYAYYSLVLTLLEYTTLLSMTLTPLKAVKTQLQGAINVLKEITSRTASSILERIKLIIHNLVPRACSETSAF